MKYVSEKNPNVSLNYVYTRKIRACLLTYLFCRNKGKINKMSNS